MITVDLISIGCLVIRPVRFGCYIDPCFIPYIDISYFYLSETIDFYFEFSVIFGRNEKTYPYIVFVTQETYL